MKTTAIAIIFISLVSPFVLATSQEPSLNDSSHEKSSIQDEKAMNTHLNMDGMHKYLDKIQLQLNEIKQETSAKKRENIMTAMQKNMQRLHRQMEKMLVQGMAHISMDEKIVLMAQHLTMMKMVMKQS